MSFLGDLLGGAKPKKPPKIFGEKAGNDERFYRNVVQFTDQLLPRVRDAAPDLDIAFDQFAADLLKRRESYVAQIPHSQDLAKRGRELELQTLGEVADRGSQARQNELGTEAREMVARNLAQRRMDADLQARDYGLSAPGVYGSGDAQEAAALAMAENNERRRERWAGENNRLNFLPQASMYADADHDLLGVLQGLSGEQRNLAYDRPKAHADLNSIYGNFVQNQTQPIGVNAVNSADFSHKANQRYSNLKAGRYGRMVSNAIAIGTAAATGNPMALSSLRLGGGDDGTGSSAPFSWVSSSSDFDGAGDWMSRLKGSGGGSSSVPFRGNSRISTAPASATFGDTTGYGTSVQPSSGWLSGHPRMKVANSGGGWF